MKKVFMLLFMATFLCISSALMAQVGINTESPDPSSYLDILGSKKGLLPPRLTAQDRKVLDESGSIDGPATGLVIYNVSDSALQVNKGTKLNPDWTTLGKECNSGTNPAPPPPTDDYIWFYFPVTPLDMTISGKVVILELYPIYLEQLAKPLGLDTKYTQDQISFVVLGYDKNAFVGTPQIVNIDSTGAEISTYTSLMYRPLPDKVTDVTYLNIAVKIKL